MTNPNWKLVVDFAHYSGARRSLLNDAERLELVLLADGFGTLRKCQEHADMLADWSHVRDSSDSAIAEDIAQAQVRALGRTAQGQAKWPAQLDVGSAHPRRDLHLARRLVAW